MRLLQKAKRVNPKRWLLSIIKNRRHHDTFDSKLHHQAQYQRKTTPRAFLGFVDIHLAEHCNLNCYSCDNFSQLAKKGYYDIDIFKKDIERLAQITNGMIDRFHLMGGEPLLNKHCLDYMRILREYFEKSSIWIITNAILLPKQDNSFWECCRDNNIELHPTKYPIKVDWDTIRQKCDAYNVELIFFNDENIQKTSFKTCLNPKGDSDPFDNFCICHRANNCNQLKNGRIYPCSVAANIEHFNAYFKENLELSPFDSIDIHAKDRNYLDILHFLSKPIPFCRYCDIRKMTQRPWLSSKKDIKEYYE